ncbi:hypothetical protein ACFLVJ_00880 [Chloroflexota bacterium]
MRIKERGQIMLMVLVALAIGAVLLIPLLNLGFTVSKISDTATTEATALYTLDGATEYVMWKLLHKDWASEFTEGGQVGTANITNCGTNLVAYVTMRAIPGEGGLVLAGEDVIQVTKTVTPSDVLNNISTLYTYTLKMEQLSSNNSQPLDAIYDLLPDDISSYVPGSSQLRVDEGAWQAFPDPDTSQLTSNGFIKWPSTYNNADGSDNFSSSSEFTGSAIPDVRGMADFDAREEKELQFQVWGKFNPAGVYCNWAILKPWNTVSGPQAPVNSGVDTEDPEYGICVDSDVVAITKEVDPSLITPGVATDVIYTVNMTNNYTSSVEIDRLIDYLPQGFIYVGPTSSTRTTGGNLTDSDPQGTISPVIINGKERYKLEWSVDGGEIGSSEKTIASGETITLEFLANATKDVSGSYFNEFIILLKVTGTGIPDDDGEPIISADEYASNYSWNQGSVTVPTYDVTSEEDGVILDSNLSLIVDGISITSYNFR